MRAKLSPHLIAILQALLVTVLWSSSWVLIKIGLQDIPALTFAGLRYSLAFLCLAPFLWRPVHWEALRRLPGRGWLNLVLLGLLFYAVTQGAQFLGLAYLPAMTVSLLLNLTTLVVAALGILLLAERPTLLQWGGVALYLVGVVAFFGPTALPKGQAAGLVVVLAGVLANAFSAILGRRINRAGELPPLVVTAVSMGIGALILLVVGLCTQGLPTLKPLHWGFVTWLAVVNTALAFTLWNHTLRTLKAMESSIINGTMMAQIALLAWLFLGEPLTWTKALGLILAALGALLVQLRLRASGTS